MILSTASGEYPIPAEVARLLPHVPSLPDATAADAEVQRKAFRDWLDAAPENAIEYERLRRWHLVQAELAAEAAARGETFTVTDDGLE